MEIKPVYVFEARLFNTVHYEFSTREQLLKCIHDFDFTKFYDINENPLQSFTNFGPICNRNFKVGARLVFEIDGYETKSDIIWGPKYYAGRNAGLDNWNVLYVDILLPATKMKSYGRKKYEKMCKKYEDGDMVFDPVRMRQVFPICAGRPSELSKFLSVIEKQKYNIERIK